MSEVAGETLSSFCRRLAQMSTAPSIDVALAILLWHDEAAPGTEMTPWDIAKIMSAEGLANPNRADLAAKLSRSGLTLRGERGFRLKARAADAIRGRLPGAFGPRTPELNLEKGYLAHEVWRDTRGYIEKVCIQLNGCYQFSFYDAASVMVRRVVETLIIEAFEHVHRESEIRDSDNNYFMLGELVNRSTDPRGLTLGREAKAALREIKKIGDRSAHNRRYNAVKADLDEIRPGVRVAVDELINMASLRRRT